MARTFDVMIIGGGMVGATLACALSAKGLSIAVLEASPPRPFEPEQPHDLRVSALSPASVKILGNLGAWAGILGRRCCPYRGMRVWETSGQGDTRFHSDSVGQPALGYIVENRVVQLALWDCLQQAQDVSLMASVRIAAIDYGGAMGSRVTLDDGEVLQARLLVGADGGESRVREAAGIGVHRWDYPQRALVASVETEAAQQDITWQRFLPTGPVAFLPLTGPHGSLVWYHHPDEIQRLMSLDEADFIDAVMRGFPKELGGIRRLEGRASFPLRRQHALNYWRPGAVLVGDAAHMIHPLAGQGVNIGLLDAACLADVLLEALDEQLPLGGSILARYEARRRNHNLGVMTAMDLIYRVFGRQDPASRLARNLGLGLTQRLAPVKKRAMRWAMGMEGDLPALARLE
ncbi:UbiH/UbiF/VisC/COQ6 family ubiquinone biosynthesis hydroxylase [Motiliproteus sp. SC1-56]|uniref:UbiH/UbiF/VisC/COQ6 family ubiquinone biosynthesis hydroxylase n=1 Tax=Motiliproteus sp. SC1-56 TaxID=2799565 RepID=UPI001A8C8BD1|nr:UbiH/UbiF/VisC/COQ6 family ubiquinone biosynthesis hydroxylase [Motiliproteus sp. SC1-56]